MSITDIIPKTAANSNGIPVNDSSFLLTRWIIQNLHDDIAQEARIDKKHIGYVESKVNLESIPSHLSAEECKIDNFSDEVRGAIRLVEKEGKVTFLASDNKSLIDKMVDYTSNALIIFVFRQAADSKILKLKRSIQNRALART